MSAVVARTGKPGTSWTREEALDWYRRARAKLGRPPTMEERQPYDRTLRRLFPEPGGIDVAAGEEQRAVGRPRGGKLP